MARSHNRPGVMFGAMILAATMLLSACSDEGDQADAGPDSTTSTADQATSSSETTTADVAPTTTAPSSPSSTEATTTTDPGPSQQALDAIADLLATIFPSIPYETEPGPAGTVAYFGFNEEGDQRNEVPAALLAQSGDEAAAGMVRITNLNARTAVTSPFEVAGRGRGYEGVLEVRAVTLDGVIVASTFTTGGSFGTSEPFTVTIDTGTHEGPLFVVVSSSTGFITLPGFAMVLLDVTPTPPGAPESAAVVRVTAGDTLNVRSGPAATFSVVDELAPDAAGVTVVSRPDGLTGWWLLETPSGVTGWASSAFLVLERSFGADEQAALLALADEFTAALTPLDSTAVASLPWSTRFATILMGWPGDSLERISSSGLRNGTDDVWTVARTWPISEAFFPPFEEATFVEFARPLGLGHSNRQVAINQALTYPFLDTPEVRNTHHVAVADLGADFIDWQVVRLHIDFTTGTPEIMAVTIEQWDP